MISRTLFTSLCVALLCLVGGTLSAGTTANNATARLTAPPLSSPLKPTSTSTFTSTTIQKQAPIHLRNGQRRCHSHGSKRLNPSTFGVKSRRLPVEVKEIPVSLDRRRVMGTVINVPVQFNIICPKTDKNANNCPSENSLRMQVDMLNLAYNDLAIGFDIVGFRYAFSDAWYRAEVGGDELSEDAAAILQQLHRGDKRTLNVFFKTNLDSMFFVGGVCLNSHTPCCLNSCSLSLPPFPSPFYRARIVGIDGQLPRGCEGTPWMVGCHIH